jgi:uncharacterized damage-inducible protein DinB
LKAVLEGVAGQQARERPIPGAHTIHELVLHLASWMRIARERLTATADRDATPEENWPAPGAWNDALLTLEKEQRALHDAVLQFPDIRLDERAPAHEPQTFYVLLHGIVQHNLYHAGQIALLRK